MTVHTRPRATRSEAFCSSARAPIRVRLPKSSLDSEADQSTDP